MVAFQPRFVSELKQVKIKLSLCLQNDRAFAERNSSKDHRFDLGIDQ